MLNNLFFFNYNFFFLSFVNLFIFCYGIFGLFSIRKNVILVFICIELILLASINNFLYYSVYLNDIFGVFFSLFILGIAACESSIGLALLVINYRHKAIISIDSFSLLKN
jgi:NADH-quinone oxidoreductase subunit K